MHKQCWAGNRFPVLNGLVKPHIEWGLNGIIMKNNNSKQVLLSLLLLVVVVAEKLRYEPDCPFHFNLARVNVFWQEVPKDGW